MRKRIRLLAGAALLVACSTFSLTFDSFAEETAEEEAFEALELQMESSVAEVSEEDETLQEEISETDETPQQEDVLSEEEKTEDEDPEEVPKKFRPGWVRDGDTVKYLDINQNYIIGWKQIGKYHYYFDSEGVMQTGLQWIEIKGKRVRYYFDSEGKMQTGWVKIGGEWYYFRNNGAAVAGWVEVDGQSYCIDSDGKMMTGWHEIRGEWYLFGSSGRIKTGWQQWKNRWHYLGADGTMQTGWLKWKNQYYYLGTGGAMQTGWLKWKGKNYYFSAKGVMQTGWLKSDGKWYYLGSDGILQAGTVIQDGMDIYYAQSDGSVRMTEGWYSEGDKVVLVGKNGKLTINKLTKYDDTYYYLRETGYGELMRNQTAARIAYGMGCDLKAAMKYAGGLKYYGKDYFTNSWGTKKLANYGFSNYSGNCYVYAAVFTELAYAMGYDVHQVRGSVRLSGGWGNNHSWVEIYKDGKTYVCDPAGLHQLGMDHAYMFQYGQRGTWMYKDQFEIVY